MCSLTKRYDQGRVLAAMRRQRYFASTIAVILGASSCDNELRLYAAVDEAMSTKVATLVTQLDDPSVDRRDEAEQQLVELAGSSSASGDAILAALPTPNDRMSQETRLRLERVRLKVEARFTAASGEAKKLSLSADQMPLNDILTEIESKTGNRVVDFRDRFGQASDEKLVTLNVTDVEFWTAMDQLLDAANMMPYAFAGEEALAIVNRTGGAAKRFGQATYAGPFRLEATSIESRRGLRDSNQDGLQVELEVAWEPRLRPVALSQPIDQVQVLFDDGQAGVPPMQASMLDIDVQPGAFSSEFVLPLQLPSRTAKSISSLKGRLLALSPSRVGEFEFANLADVARPGATPITRRVSDVSVTIDRVRKNNVLWEVHMRIRIDSDEAALESNRGWVFQNTTYMLDANGEVIDHLGFETTMQTEREMGFAFLFELPGEIDQYTWIYKSPAAISSVPVEYEIADIPLP